MKILICDDSAFARKSISRSIVCDNSIHILEAQDGYEALQMMMEQNIDLLFLDLTMPIMDGFELLANLPVSQYHTDVIVVSGDVQQEAKQRCLELGAMAFLCKPFARNEIEPLFAKFGLHFAEPHLKPAANPEPKLSAFAKFKEITNIALGKGAAIMADHLNEFIQLPVPSVGPLTYGELCMTMADVIKREGAVAVSQRFVGGGIHGEALVCLWGNDIDNIGQKLGYLRDFSTHNEIILNVSNLLVSSFLTSLGGQLDKQFSLRQPAIIDSLSSQYDSARESDELFTVEYTYFAESLDFECEVLFLIDKPSVSIIYEIMESI
ncbi:response regulator [Vibrio sp. IRLE0018]|uniref:response regulator n=1 Tax=Vibrio floridensis TaxID=2908007 RepID=UPI001A345CAD|nr:response regulator [Vibrio floridensis]MCF8780013.1 response regulator [Vibrio floridensis]HAS6349467.1 response regulator [Vibrio vulnificus]